jgi:dihydroorotase-like cyclic amidohydrolase
VTAGQLADLAVLGGQVVTPDGVRRVGVAMRDGLIVAVGPEAELPTAREEIDVSGALVLPGAIDAHLHYDRDGRLTDRVDAATRSGACGGVTSAVAFLLWQPERRLTETLDEAIRSTCAPTTSTPWPTSRRSSSAECRASRWRWRTSGAG